MDLCHAHGGEHFAAGATLGQLGLPLAADKLAISGGCAIQVRINMETMLPDGSVAPTGGTLTTYEEPGGRGVRVDAMGYAGCVFLRITYKASYSAAPRCRIIVTLPY